MNVTFSCYNDHTSPIFKHPYITKCLKVIYYLNCIFMFNFYHTLLPSAFNNFSGFTAISPRHKYETRLASKTCNVYQNELHVITRFSGHIARTLVRNHIV